MFELNEEVLYTLGFYQKRIVKIVRITPTGRFKVEGLDVQFDSNGRGMGDSYKAQVQKLTDKMRYQMKVEEALSILKHFAWEKLPWEDIIRISEKAQTAQKAAELMKIYKAKKEP